MPFPRSLSLRTFKRSALAAGAALTVAGAAVGVVGAQQAQPSPTATARAGAQGMPAPGVKAGHEQFLSTLAAKLGITVDRLNQALTDTRTELGMPEGGRGFFGGRGGPEMGHRGFGGSLEAAATAMGLTMDQLRQELPGKTLADVVRAHNVDPARVATALKNDANTRIDQAVSAGRLTAEQATQAKQRAAEQVDQLMTRQTPTGQPGQPGRGPGGERGRPAATAAPTQ